MFYQSNLEIGLSSSETLMSLRFYAYQHTNALFYFRSSNYLLPSVLGKVVKPNTENNRACY